MEGLLCDLLWADPSDDPGVTNIESLSDPVRVVVHGRNAWQALLLRVSPMMCAWLGMG